MDPSLPANAGQDDVDMLRGGSNVPAAIVTTLPVSEMRLETTDAELSVQPSEPPRDIVRMSCPSETPRSNASMMTRHRISEDDAREL